VSINVVHLEIRRAGKQAVPLTCSRHECCLRRGLDS
jgi:hypothetical protein